MGQDISPEERLLKLIRSKESKRCADEPARKEPTGFFTPQPATVPASAPAASRRGARRQAQRPSGYRGKAAVPPSTVIRLEYINIILAVALVGLAAYLVSYFVKKPADAVRSIEEKLKAEQTVALQKSGARESVADKRPPLSYFAEQASTKNIFNPLVKDETAAAPAEQGPKLEDIKGQLNLIGIMGGERPQAIIENKKSQKTYFLYKGESFDDITVKDIFENKVVLDYKDQPFELVL